MAINKVIYGGGTLIDLTTDTVTAETLKTGVTAHDKAGNQITGTFDTTTGSVHQDDDGYVVINDGDDTGIAFLPLNVTSNGTYVADSNAGYTPVTVDVHNELQNKSVTPTESPQAVVPDSGYDGMGRVDVAAISSTYVGTGIARKSVNDLVVSGSTVTTPAGYFASAVGVNVQTGSITIPTISLSFVPSISLNLSTGQITATVSGTSDITPTFSSGYIGSVVGGTVKIAKNAVLGLAVQSAKTITPTTATQLVVASGKYTTGPVYVDPMPTGSLTNVTIGTGRIGEVTVGSSTLGVLAPAISVDPATGLIRASFSSTISGIKPVATAGYISADATHSITAFGSNALQLSVQPAKTITPSQASQIAISSGYYATGSVVVGAIPGNYVIPSGDYTISSNGYYEVPHYYGVSVNLPFYNIYKSLAFRSTIASSAAGVSEWADSLSQVEGGQFANQDFNGSFTFNNVKNINTYGFGFARGTTIPPQSSFTLNFPSTSEIGHGAFIYNSGIRSVNAATCRTIRDSAFYNCSKLASAIFPAVVSISACAFQACSSLTTLSFPACTYIAYSAFADCKELSLASFPALSYISDWAFVRCSKLSLLSFPSVTTIGKYAFSGCASLSSVNFPSCITIGSSCFNVCGALTTVSFPKCERIETAAFSGCYKLESVYFPNCTILSNNAFIRCSSLVSVNFPSCTSIGQWCFGSCFSLQYASFPAVVSIALWAFAQCSELSVFSIASMCSYIGGSAFSQCTKLESVYVHCSSTTLPTLGNHNAFFSTPLQDSSYLGHFGSIYVKSSLLEKFKTAVAWSYYSSRMVGF